MDKILEKDLIQLFKDRKVSFASLSEGNPLLDDKTFVLGVLNVNTGKSGVCINGISDRLRDDHDVILESVKQVPWNLQYASDRLRADKHIVLQSLEVEGIDGFTSGGATFDCCAPELTDNEAFAYSALRLNPWCYGQLSDRLKEMPTVAKLAVSKDPDNFYKIPQNLKDDKEIAKIAVEGKPTILGKLSENLRDDPEIVLAAFKSVDIMDKTEIANNYATDREGLKDLLSINVSDRLIKLIGSGNREKKLEIICAATNLTPKTIEDSGQVLDRKL